VSGHYGMRHRAYVLASLPEFCACGGSQRFALISLLRMRATGVVRCPHCDPEDGHDPIEIRIHRMRTDIPRNGAA
jgi:hypothetical protein